jgi:hypothetical protein
VTHVAVVKTVANRFTLVSRKKVKIKRKNNMKRVGQNDVLPSFCI